MDKSIELSLKTWYPKGHPLHYDLHHPLGKLVGEWGELLDDYMKQLYKPGYEWKPLDELVDIWYYIRILAYQARIKLKLISLSHFDDEELNSIEFMINRAITSTSGRFNDLLKAKAENRIYRLERNALSSSLPYNYSILSHLCTHKKFELGLTIDQLTEASWEKLKPGSERGEEWMKAGKEIK